MNRLLKVGLIILISVVLNLSAQNDFKLKVKTDNTGSSTNTQFTLPIQSTGTVDCSINWGDGNTEAVTANGNITHTYTTAGTYTVSISGTSFPGIAFFMAGDCLKLLEVEQWGTDVKWKSMYGAFFGCTNVEITATDTPDWLLVTDYTFAFTNCYAIDDDFAGYDVSNGETFLYAWAGCTDILNFASLDFSSAISLERTWFLCSKMVSFGAISVPNCTSLRETWWKCSKLTAYPVITNSSNVTDAAAAFVELTIPTVFPATDFSNVTDFEGTWWHNASLATFNDPNTSQGQNFLEAFKNCYALKTIPILDFSSMTDGTNCFQNVTLDSDIWNQILINTQVNNTNLNVTFSGGNSKRFYNGTYAKYQLETDKGWTIIDGGTDSAENLLLPVATSSVVSPAHIEGSHVTGLPTITADTNTLTAIIIDSNRFYAGVPLSATAATALSVVYTDQTINQSITWTSTDIGTVSSGEVISIRKNDSLLLTANSATIDGALEIDGDGNGSYELSGNEGDKFSQQFTTAGSFTILAKINGIVVGTLIVNVIDIDYDPYLGSIACEIDYSRIKNINITGGFNADVTFTGNDLLQVTNQATAANGSTINLMPTAAGDTILISRIGGEFGPIISTYEIDEFDLTSQSAQYIGLVEEYPDGSMLVETNLAITPKISGLEVVLHIFVSGVTFPDATLDKTIMTDSFDNSSPALFPYQMIVNQGVTTGSCHTIKVYQNSVQIGD